VNRGGYYKSKHKSTPSPGPNTRGTLGLTQDQPACQR